MKEATQHGWPFAESVLITMLLQTIGKDRTHKICREVAEAKIFEKCSRLCLPMSKVV